MTAANNSPTGLEFLITERNCTFQLLLCQKKMTNQPQDNSLNYLIDLMFTKVNRLFVLSFVRNAEGDHRRSFSSYYVLNARIKDFNVLIDGKSLFDLPVKDEEESYEKNIKMSRNNENTAGSLLDFTYFKKITN